MATFNYDDGATNGGSGGGNFDDPANWIENATPSSSDTATLASLPTVVSSFNGTVACPLDAASFSLDGTAIYNGNVTNAASVNGGNFNADIHFTGTYSNSYANVSGTTYAGSGSTFSVSPGTMPIVSVNTTFGNFTYGDVSDTGSTISTGTFGTVTLSSSSTISGGTFTAVVNNGGTISGGTISTLTDTNGSISDGTFGSVTATGTTISGGSFTNGGGTYTACSISGGTFSCACTFTYISCTITGGTFGGTADFGGIVNVTGAPTFGSVTFSGTSVVTHIVAFNTGSITQLTFDAAWPDAADVRNGTPRGFVSDISLGNGTLTSGGGTRGYAS